MKYAVISDIHGNLPALRAVLEDAERQGVSGYIFAGDYCLSGHYPDQCVTAVRNIENKYIIRGNEEKYLENLIGKDQSGWTDGQMQISYWCFRNIGSDNLGYLMSLPHTADFSLGGTDIRVAHSSERFIGGIEMREFGSASLAERYAGTEVNVRSFGSDIRAFLEKDPESHRAISALKDGVYIFGHSHVQWSFKTNGRNVYLINPGSCGLPLDGMKNSVPYTVLSFSDSGIADIDERRVMFDTEKYVESLKASEQFRQANVWSRVIIRELLTAREHLAFFLRFTERYAESIGDTKRPYSAETWEKAYQAWELSLNGQ